uniref:G protein-coupled receptor 156 n=1 Tax=Sinocyclocheilus grahami TaxID=75366 RepID=A0A672RJA7_SINGR
MEAGLNCSSHCESGVCFIYPGVNSQQGWDVLQRLCAGVDVQSRSLSPALRAVVWTLLSCGILLALFFLIFTLRFKNNRIVKMSSPNLNVLTLCGSVLTYSSGFLFALEERARMWTLCIGSSLVFGPILGKTWRLYRVFTQRVPDKRVIIRDIQLMGLVALLVLVDVVVLAAWGLTDPIKCSRSISALVVERDASYSLSQLDSCSSLYSDLWVILLSVLKGSLLLYSTYLAGLTSNVSLPPVNQSMTIIGAVCLVTISSAVAVPVSLYLNAWPNVVYSVVSGAIFICTVAINCLLFVPQWRQFEEETNSHSSQMAKYFSSPSKTTHSMYSEDEIYYLLGENDSMKRLISEKNAVIDSLQEQVNNAKDKLLKLMTASHPLDGEMDSSNTNLNSTSTQTTVVSPDSPTLLLMKYSEVAPTRALAPPPYVPPPPLPAHTTSQQTSSEGPVATEVPLSSPSHLRYSPPQDNSSNEVSQVVSLNGNTEEEVPTMNNLRNSGLGKEISEKPLDVPSDRTNLAQGSSPLGPARCSSPQVESPVPSASVELPAMSPTGRQGFVTNEQLVEILQDLSVDAVSSSAKSHDRASLNPDELSTTLSPRSPLQFFFPTISPYAMRKRRPPFYSSRGVPPPYYFPGSVPPGRRRAPALPDHGQLRDDDSQRQDLWHKGKRRRRGEKAQARCGLGQESWECPSHKCSITPFTGQVPQPASAGLIEGVKHSEEPYDYSDSDSSSSEDYCYYQRPYCRACHQLYDSTDSLTSGTSDSEDEDFYKSAHPAVNFKMDLKPTFV